MLEQSRILLTLRYLFENTDEEHAVSTRDIKTMLEQHGVQAPVSRTIDADMDLLAAADLSFAPSTALESVRRAADVVLDAETGGIFPALVAYLRRQAEA